jgi:fatty acid desaturase
MDAQEDSKAVVKHISDEERLARVKKLANTIREVRKLSEVNAFRAFWSIITQWAVIILLCWVAQPALHVLGSVVTGIAAGSRDFPSVSHIVLSLLLYLFCAFFIATRQHALLILMHDGAHFRLHKDKEKNDLISNLLCAFPLGLSTSCYRKTHFEHHRFLGTDKDPDLVAMSKDVGYSWPKKMGQAFKVFLADLLGIALKRNWVAYRQWSFIVNLRKLGRSEASSLFGFFFLLLCGVIVFGQAATLAVVVSVLFLWIIPSMTFLSFIFRVRSIAEHTGVSGKTEYSKSRTVKPGFLERLVFSPCNVNYHLEHHLYSSVPFYNLPKLHKILYDHYDGKAEIETGYAKLIVQKLITEPAEEKPDEKPEETKDK